MTMSLLLRAEKSQTSIVRMAPRMPHRLRLAGPQGPAVRVARQVSVVGGIAAADAGPAAAAAVAAGAVDRSKYANPEVCGS